MKWKRIAFVILIGSLSLGSSASVARHECGSRGTVAACCKSIESCRKSACCKDASCSEKCKDNAACCSHSTNSCGVKDGKHCCAITCGTDNKKS